MPGTRTTIRRPRSWARCSTTPAARIATASPRSMPCTSGRGGTTRTARSPTGIRRCRAGITGAWRRDTAGAGGGAARTRRAPGPECALVHRYVHLPARQLRRGRLGHRGALEEARVLRAPQVHGVREDEVTEVVRRDVAVLHQLVGLGQRIAHVDHV